MPHKHYENITTLALDDPASQIGMVGHHEDDVRRKIGAWRWPLVFKHRERILQAIVGKYAIDWGGAAGPIGYGTVIVDRLARDHRTLDDVPPAADAIFTSHTLEHVVDLGLSVACLYLKLADEGTLICHVPSWRKEMLRAENWEYHEQTFCLEGDDCPYTALDTFLERQGFRVDVRDSTESDIMVICRK